MSSAGGPAAARWAWELSGLWRSLSLRNRSHVLILGSSALTFAGVLVFQMGRGRGYPGSAQVAANGAVMLFLAWAVAREIDPDFPASAFLAAGVGGLILLAGSAPAGTAIALLVALRIVTRSTGKAPTTLDLVALPLLAGMVAAAPGGWIGGVAVAAALAWDSRLPGAASRRNYAGALFTLAAALVAAWQLESFNIEFVPPDPVDWSAVGAGLLGFLLMSRYVPRSLQDRGGTTIPPQRLRAARLLAVTLGVSAFALFGSAAIPMLAGLWGSLVGVALHSRFSTASPAGR